MPAPTKDEIIMEMYVAWKTLTVLEDRSISNFKSIVNQCINENEKNLSTKVTGHSTCSTGSVCVLSRKSETGIRHEIMVTATFSIEGTV